MTREDRFSRENGQTGPGRTAGTSGDDPAILRRRLDYAWEEIEQLTKELALARKTASEQTDNSAKSLLAAKQEIDTLSQSLDEKERALTANTEQCRYFEGEIATLHQEIHEKERLLEESAAQYQRTSGDLEERDLTVDGLQQKLAHTHAELEAAREQAAGLQTDQQETAARLQDLLTASEAAGAAQVPDTAREPAPSPYRQILANRFLHGLLAGLCAATLTGGLLWPRPELLQPAGNGAAAEDANGNTPPGPDQPALATDIQKKPLAPIRQLRDRLPDGSLGPRMILIEPGDFSMGNRGSQPLGDEWPVHEVEIRPFSLGAYEVTFDEYDRFARTMGRRLPDDFGQGRGQRPVVGVSWSDAQAYADWLSRRTGHRYRLPSEAEWEYAARAGSETAFWWGPRLEAGRAVCFDCETQWGNRSTVPVGRFQPNPFGLYDTAGNAMEWVADCYHPNYNGAPADGGAWLDGDCGFRLARGGAFNKPSKSMRSTARHRYEIETRINMLGFRLARDA